MTTQNNTEGRSERLERFLAVDPNNVDLLWDFAQASEIEGNTEKAISAYQKLLSLDDGRPETLNHLGLLYMNVGQWQQAISVLTEAVDKQENVAEVLFNLGYSELSIGDFQSSYKHLESATKLSPDDARYYYCLALAADELGDIEHYQNNLHAALEKDPNHYGARLLSAFSELENGKLESAKKEIIRLLNSHPNSIDAPVLQAQIALLEFDANKSLQILRDVYARAPDNLDVVLAMAQTYLMLQRLGHARTMYEKSISLDSSSYPSQLGLGWVALLQDDLTIAEIAFKSSLALKPDEADPLAGMAIIYFGRKNFEESEKLANKALAIDADNVPALFVKTALERKKGDETEAVEFGQKLFNSHSLGPFGWQTSEIMKQFEKSATGKRVIRNLARHIKRNQNIAR